MWDHDAQLKRKRVGNTFFSSLTQKPATPHYLPRPHACVFSSTRSPKPLTERDIELAVGRVLLAEGTGRKIEADRDVPGRLCADAEWYGAVFQRGAKKESKQARKKKRRTAYLRRLCSMM